MGWLATALALLVAWKAFQRVRVDQQRGIPINWPKMLVTLAGGGVVTLAAIGVLYAGLTAGRGGLAIALFLVVFAGGLVAVILAVNRRWPPEKT